MSVFKQPLIQNPPQNLKRRDNKPADYDSDNDYDDDNDNDDGDDGDD